MNAPSQDPSFVPGQPSPLADQSKAAHTAHDAARRASKDSEAVARSAADTVSAAGDATTATLSSVAAARSAAAEIVAAAASVAAEIAAREALAVQDEADRRAVDVAAAAVTALELVAVDDGAVTPDEARRLAARIAQLVSADVVNQARLTDEAAGRVAQAVALAAEAAALAAWTAASLVEAAALGARAAAEETAHASAATEEASVVAVNSAGHVADLARRRVAQLRQAPMVAELRLALERDELELHYQAMIDVASGAVTGVEALIRWHHPSRGLLQPASFLDVAEGPYLVEPIGDWVLRSACRQAAIWSNRYGDRAPRVWVNVSCDQLGRDHLVGVVADVLEETHLPPDRLGMEITERQLARRVGHVIDDLEAFRRLGVALSVDDFGTGYASLDYLRRFSFDEIKIDRSFVSGLQQRTDRAVASSIVALGRSLGLTVVAEGVENASQLELVTDLGVDVTQGYLHHRPAPAAEIDQQIGAHATV